MSIKKAVDACKDRLYDAQERIAELESALSESERISKSWKAQWGNLLHENARLEKDNAYLQRIVDRYYELSTEALKK